MGPRFICLFLRHGKFCLLPLSNFPRQTEKDRALLLLPSPSQLGKQRPSASPSLQTKDHLKRLSKKHALSWKLEKLVGNIHQAVIAGTGSGPAAPQGRGWAGGCPAGAALLPPAAPRDLSALSSFACSGCGRYPSAETCRSVVQFSSGITLKGP